MLDKNPESRITVPQIKVSVTNNITESKDFIDDIKVGIIVLLSKVHPWVTRHGAEPLPPEDDNCCSLIEVTEEEVENSVKHIPSLATVVSMPALGGLLR